MFGLMNVTVTLTWWVRISPNNSWMKSAAAKSVHHCYALQYVPRLVHAALSSGSVRDTHFFPVLSGRPSCDCMCGKLLSALWFYLETSWYKRTGINNKIEVRQLFIHSQHLFSIMSQPGIHDVFTQYLFYISTSSVLYSLRLRVHKITSEQRRR